MTTTNKIVTVNRGATYRNNNTKDLVVAFFIDRPRSEVRFAPLGIMTGQEDRASIEDFLRDFTLVAEKGEAVKELAD